IAIILMVGEAASAEQTPGQASTDWTQNYGERNKDCLEWTDTCVNCVRAQSGEDFSCSNIGIACQPKDVTCVRRAEEKTKLRRAPHKVQKSMPSDCLALRAAHSGRYRNSQLCPSSGPS